MNQFQNKLPQYLDPNNKKIRSIIFEENPEISRDHLLDALINVIQTSATYSSHKTMIFRLIEEEKSLKDISVILNISFIEAYIIAKEIGL